MTECISLPSPVSESNSITSMRRQRAPASRYSPSPFRSSRRRIETSGPSPSLPAESSSTSSTLADWEAWRPGAPPKITSCIDCPRTAIGDCSPRAHSTASVTLDLPDPFGPTITLVPGPKSSRVRSGKDLNPFRVMLFRYTRPPLRSSAHLLEGRLGCDLLGVLLAAPAPATDLPAVERGQDRECPLMGRPFLGDHFVADHRSAPSQALLQRGLEVHRPLDGVVELG